MSENGDLTPPPAETIPETPEQASSGSQLYIPFGQAAVREKDEIFWGWHDFFMFVFITVMALAMTMAFAMGIRSLFHLSEVRMNIVMVIAQFAAYGVSFTCLKLMFRGEYGEPLMRSLHWLPTPLQPSTLAMMGLGLAFTIALMSYFLSPQVDTPMNRLLADRPTAIVIAILGVTVAPLSEELAFRGLLQPLLIRSIGVAPGILGTAILFGAMHVEQYGSWQSGLLITLAGAGFGAMRHWSGSTRASAIMHAGYNSALFLLFFAQKGPGQHG